MPIEFARFEMSAPDDFGALAPALQLLGGDSITRLGLLVKVEGTATINDFSRTLALRAFDDQISSLHLSGLRQLQLIVSTGCEGLITPGGMIFAERPAKGRFEGLRLGMAVSDNISSPTLITPEHVNIAAQTTRAAMRDAGLAVDDVALVLMKSPVLTHAMAVGLPQAQRARANSTSLSRGVAALGIGVALGEINARDICDEAIMGRPDLYSQRGMVFSGTETQRCEVIVLGNDPSFPKVLRSGIVQDVIDFEGFASILSGSADASATKARDLIQHKKVVATFLKAGAPSSGRIRGQRTTIFSSELDSDKHLRAAASGVMGALLGDTRSFISGGAEHQAPEGGCVFAALVEH